MTVTLTGYSVPETLTDDTGNTLKGVTVNVTGPAAYTGTATSDPTTGALRLGPLPVGDYTITYQGRAVTVPVMPNPALLATRRLALAPTAARFTTMDRRYGIAGSVAPLVSGQLFVQAIDLPAGEPVSTITFLLGGTSVSPSNFWYSLWDQNLNKLGVTADLGSTVPTLQSFLSLAMASPYTTTYDGLHYLGVVSVAATPPGLKGTTAASTLTGAPPILAGNSTTGLTTPASAPATAAVLTPFGGIAYGYTS